MWPQPFSCGNAFPAVIVTASKVSLQCGHSLSAVEMPFSGDVLPGRTFPFNVATAFQLWK